MTRYWNKKVAKPICQLQARQYLFVDFITDSTRTTGLTEELVNETPPLPWVGIFQKANLLRVKGFFPGSNPITHPVAQLSPSAIPIKMERTLPSEDELLNARCHSGSVGGMDFAEFSKKWISIAVFTSVLNDSVKLSTEATLSRPVNQWWLETHLPKALIADSGNRRTLCFWALWARIVISWDGLGLQNTELWFDVPRFALTTGLSYRVHH